MKDISLLKVDDIPGNFRKIAEIVGIEKTFLITQALAGKTIYIPTEDCLYYQALRSVLRRDYRKGATVQEISRRYEVSVSTVYRHIR